MLTLSLLRHAKSSWDDPELQDFDRPLNARGLEAAPRMGRHMQTLGLAPDLVLCSSAMRTRQTAALLLEALNPTPPGIAYEEALYEASRGALIDRLARVGNAVRHVLLIGHNPGLHDLVLHLADRPMPPLLAAIEKKFPTGALVVFRSKAKAWSDFHRQHCRVTHVATPRTLPAVT